MTSLPHIIVSRLDLARLQALLRSSSADAQPQLDSLRVELDRAEVVEDDAMPPTVATMGSTIRFVIEPMGKQFELTLSYPEDVRGDPRRISVLAPVGSALLGLSVGQTIDWQAPGGRSLKLRVKSVRYQPEAAGDFHR